MIDSGSNIQLVEAGTSSSELADLLGGEVFLFGPKGDSLSDMQAGQEGTESSMLQSQMRAGRKWNAGVHPQPKPAPFYRQFDKRKF